MVTRLVASRADAEKKRRERQAEAVAVAGRQRQRRDGEDDVLNELELKYWEEVEPDLANPAHACR
jgi:hypothetical protein